MNRRDAAIVWTLGPAFVLSVCGVLVASWIRMDDEAPRLREVRLETRGAAFVRAEGDDRERNPTIETSVGERIRIVVRNSDVGVVHAISISELGQATRVLRTGEQVAVVITPTVPGTYEYVCPYHVPLMKGTIVVQPEAN